MRLTRIEGFLPHVFVSVTTILYRRKSALSDLVKRMFNVGELDEVWLSDITYLRTGEAGCICVSSRMGHSRRVLGWDMDSVDACV